jgi:hypothetical protein
MKRLFSIIVIASVLCIFSISASAQKAKSALLPENQAKSLANQCSRPSPKEFTDTWVPSKAEIDRMEANLPAIKKLKVKHCCIEGAKIADPATYYRHYVGLVLGGKKLIYINAFGDEDPGGFRKEAAVVICDGGNAWGVLYDPASGKFFDLAINGIG